MSRQEQAVRAVQSGTQALSRAAAKWFGKRSGLFAFFIGLSIVLRMATFGHPNIDGDEAFYFLVGQAMHDGAVPYVDVWDRKPVGLFVIYYLIAGLSDSVVAYQVAAALFAGATAAVIARIASRWAGLRGGVLAGCVYLLLLPVFWGYGGQAPVFYNLFVSAAALLVLEAMPALRRGDLAWQANLAMSLCGIAITVKQTTLFESVFLGLAAITALYRSPAPRRRIAGVLLGFAVLGAAPTLLVTAWYWLSGHWAEYWHAMVISNLAKLKPDGITILARSLGLYMRLAPLACVALLGLILRYRGKAPFRDRPFVFGWLAAALVGFLSVPNFYMHYALPLLVPMCIAAAAFFARKDLGLLAFLIVAGLSLRWFYPFSFEYTREARIAIEHMAKSIRAHDGGGGLLVFDGPPLLYRMAGKTFPSPLVLPMHLNYSIEKNVSHLNTRDEVARVLEKGPGVVVVPVIQRNPRNEETWSLVLSYVHRNCRLVDRQSSYEFISSAPMAIYGDCKAKSPPAPERATILTP